MSVETSAQRNPADANGIGYIPSADQADMDVVMQSLIWGRPENLPEPSIKISGLKSDTEYSVSVYSGLTNEIDMDLNASGSGAGSTSSSLGPIISNVAYDSHSPHDLGLVNTGADGVLSIFTTTPPVSDTAVANNGWIQGVAITQVPEPTSISMVILGMVTLVGALRRRR